jgi:hypothetical protein
LALFLTSLYFGIKPPKRIYWKNAILLNLPALVDGYTQFKGCRVSNNSLRFITGVLAGIGAGAFLFPVYFKLIGSLAGRFRRIVSSRRREGNGSGSFCFNKNSKEEVKR